jgi:hypothetical protein
MEFAYDGGGLGKGGTTTLFVDGDQVGSTRVERTQLSTTRFRDRRGRHRRRFASG